MYLLPAVASGAPLLDVIHHCDALALLRALPDGCVDEIVIDPPYGCGSQVSAWRSPDERFPEIVGVDAIDTTWMPHAFRILRDACAMYVFAKWVNLGEWKNHLEAAGFIARSCIVWDKLQHGTGDLEGAYGPQHEMILYVTKGRHLLRGPRPVDIWHMPKVKPTALSHPYEKPVGVMERLIRHSSDPGNVVLDFFTGSGVVCEAARNLGRHYIGCEIDGGYAVKARARLALPYTLPMFA